MGVKILKYAEVGMFHVNSLCKYGNQGRGLAVPSLQDSPFEKMVSKDFVISSFAQCAHFLMYFFFLSFQKKSILKLPCKYIFLMIVNIVQ